MAEFAAHTGNWLQLQQMRLLTRRFRLRWEDVYGGSMNPLPSQDGYGQLGYLVARSMSIRDERRFPGPEALNDLLGVLVRIGASPEAWKLLRAADRYGAATAVTPVVRLQIAEGWGRCQYLAWMRRSLEREAER